MPSDSSTTVTVRLDRKLRARLEKLAVSTRRSKSFLAAEAIAAYVDEQAWQVAEIEEGRQQADAGGPFFAHEDVVKWLRSWGKKNELPPPR